MNTESRIASTSFITIVLCGLISLFLPGCGLVGASGNGEFLMMGSAEGVRAYMQGQNGLVTNAKTPSGVESPYWTGERHHEEQKTKRAYAPGFLQNLFGKGGK